MTTQWVIVGRRDAQRAVRRSAETKAETATGLDKLDDVGEINHTNDIAPYCDLELPDRSDTTGNLSSTARTSV